MCVKLLLYIKNFKNCTQTKIYVISETTNTDKKILSGIIWVAIAISNLSVTKNLTSNTYA